MPPSKLVDADDATFNAFAAVVAADISHTTRDCEITDEATWRHLLEPLFCISLLMGLDDCARQVLPHLQANEAKEEVRLTSWRVYSAYLQAAQAAETKTGPEFALVFEASESSFINTLPWAVVQDTLRQQDSIYQTAANIKDQLDPLYAKTGTLDLPGARSLIIQRARAKVYLPLVKLDAPVLKTYLDAHATARTDILH